jgi:hypothetical protein
MSIEGAITRGRAAAEALMVDECTIRRQTGETTGTGGVITPTYDDLYTGKCRVQVRAESGQATTVGEAALIIQRHEVQLPILVTGLAEGDRITITASALDPELVGAEYVVRDVLRKSHLTSRRVTVIEVTS